MCIITILPVLKEKNKIRDGHPTTWQIIKILPRASQHVINNLPVHKEKNNT